MNYALTLADKIRDLSISIADIEVAIASTKHKLVALETQAEGEAAFDSTLKNDKQRIYHAFKLLQENPEYEPLQAELQQLIYARSIEVAELEYNRSQLSLSKMAERSRMVAKLEKCELADILGE